MPKLIVTTNKLNKRRSIPVSLPDASSISGTVNKGFTFQGEEIKVLPNPALGTWYMDRDNNYYWGGGFKMGTTSAEIKACINILYHKFDCLISQFK